MFNKSDVETRHINIYKIEPSSLSIRVSVPTSTGTFTQTQPQSQIPRRSLDLSLRLTETRLISH